MPEKPILEITTTRRLAHPPERVWQAWTVPDQIVQWWGPQGFSTTIHKMDFRTGGEWVFTMHGPDGTDYPNHKIFREIVSPRRLVMAHIGSPKHDMTVTFEPHEGGTQVTIHHLFANETDYDLAINKHHAKEGAAQHLGRLADFLQSA